MLLLLLDLHIAQHITNSTVATTHHVFPKHAIFQNFQKYTCSNFFCAPFPGILGLLPLIFEFHYSRYIFHIFSQPSTSILTSFFTLLPNGLTEPSYVLALHSGCPTHTWPTTRTTTPESGGPNLHSHPYTTNLLLL